ncbi:MAG: hypothetical protein AAGI11_11910 [Pseudomonadota bacterium]
MKSLISLVVLVVVGGVAFGLGRLTSAPPQFTPVEAESADALAAAYDEFIRSQQETVALLRASPFFDDDQARAEAYRSVLYATVGSIKAGALQSHDFPRFSRAVDWTSKAGLDNPDNNYYIALIDDDAEYRISGKRGTTANLIFQLVIGQPAVRGAGSSTNVSVLYDRDMVFDEAGNYEVVVSRQDPGPGVNWLPNGEGAQTILLRFTYNDWAGESHRAPYIEKIGREGAHAPRLSSDAMAFGLREAAVSLYDRTATWLDFSTKAWTLRGGNSITEARPSRGGLVGQYSAFGNWELEDDEALILSTSRSAADYQGIELGNLWFVSLDYETRTSTLNLSQMHCGADERCHAVISHRDPGVQNWLDTEGHRRGLIMMRWQGLPAPLAEQMQPEARVVPFARLRDELPADIPAFSSEERREQIDARRRAVHQRFGG